MTFSKGISWPTRGGIRIAGAAIACVVALSSAGAAEAAKCTQKGTGGVDVLKGTNKKDVLCGKGGADVLIGKGGNDVMKGGGGDDSLAGKAGDDTLAGGPGNDTLSGGKGNDKLKGQAGKDVAGFSDSPTSLQVDLGAGTATGNGNDTLIAVETVIGSDSDDELVGGPGPDELSGGEGNDSIVGLGGNDVLKGQGGMDSTTYASAPGAIIADLRAGTVGGDGNDTLSGIEELTGTAGDDTIEGDGANNDLDGAGGRDTLSFAGAPGGVVADIGDGAVNGDGDDSLHNFEAVAGSAHDDRLVGGPGNDTLSGGPGADTLIGLGGNDLLDGQDGVDRAAYAYSTSPIDANLRTGKVVGEGTDTLAAVENVTGSPQGDTFAGNAGNNGFDGAEGGDTVSFAASPNGIQTDLVSGDTIGDGADKLLGIDNVIGSNDPDTIIGDDGNNGIVGGSGADTLLGAGGADVVSGEIGDDNVNGDDGDDQLFGGPDDDHLDGGTGANNCDGGTGVNTYAGNCDGTAPTLTTLGISPASVDTESAPRDIDFTLHLADDAAGVDAESSAVIVHAPGTGMPTFEAPLTRTNGDPLDGDYTARITLPRYAAEGTWTVEVRLVDQSSNQTTITTQQLTTAGQPHSFSQTGTGDTSGPSLTAFGFTPTSVDTANAPANLNFTLTLTDDLAGVDPAASRVVVHGPGGDPTFEAPLTLVSGNATDGDYTGQITLPRYSAQGAWTVELLLVDRASNQLLLTSGDLGASGGFTQTGTGDTVAPTLTGFTLSPPTINTAELAQTINFTVAGTDALSGIDPAASRVIAIDPLNQPRGESPLTLVSGTSQNGNYTAAITVAQGSATGTWRLKVQLVDHVGNTRVVNFTDLAAAGLPSSFQNVAPSGT